MVQWCNSSLISVNFSLHNRTKNRSQQAPRSRGELNHYIVGHHEVELNEKLWRKTKSEAPPTSFSMTFHLSLFSVPLSDFSKGPTPITFLSLPYNSIISMQEPLVLKSVYQKQQLPWIQKKSGHMWSMWYTTHTHKLMLMCYSEWQHWHLIVIGLANTGWNSYHYVSDSRNKCT